MALVDAGSHSRTQGGGEGMKPAMRIREMQPDDCDALAEVRDTTPALFRQYLAEHAEGRRTILIAEVDGDVAGCLTIEWEAGHPVLRRRAVPEVVDLVVVRQHRRNGIGTALMDDAERRIAEVSDTAGVAVGLSRDHGAAQVFYAHRGYVPDGCGANYRGSYVEFGAQVRADNGLVLVLAKGLGV